MDQEFVTAGEFGRWRQDFQAFQARLDDRLESGFGGLNTRLDDLNGRTRKQAEAIVALDVRVSEIASHGCGQLEAHRAAMDAVAETRGGSRRPYVIGGGIVAGIAAVAEIVKAVFLSKP